MTATRELSTLVTDETRLVRAWVNFNGTGTVAIRSQYNVSSITDNGAGDYSVNFTNGFASASDYAACVTASCEGGAAAIPTVHQNGIFNSSTGTAFRFRLSDGNSYANQRDSTNIYVMIFGN